VFEIANPLGAAPLTVGELMGARAPVLGSIVYVHTDESVSLTTKRKWPL
jgi:hypothetical protein